MKIKHDVHTHSLYSLCCYDPQATVTRYLERAAELGHKTFGISNHLWDEKMPGSSDWYRKQMINYGLEARHAVPADTCGMKVLIGAESEYAHYKNALGMSAETAKRFDYMLIPHTHMHMRGFVMQDPPEIIAAREEFKNQIIAKFPELDEKKAASMAAVFKEVDLAGSVENYDPIKYFANFMVESFKGLMENEEFIKIAAAVPTSIAHPFNPCGFSEDVKAKIIRGVSDDDYRECFRMAKKLGVAMEVNTASFARKEDDYANEENIHTFRLAKEIGVKFTFGTDAHSVTALDNISKGERISELIGITESDLMDFVK